MNAAIRPRTLLVKSLVRGVVELAILAGVLFGIAGRVDWPAAWLIVLLFAWQVFSGWLLFRHDPELFEERLTTASNVPHWDLLIARGNRILQPIFLATAALDAGRFRWSAMPVVVQVIGTAAVVVAVGVVWWCAAVNHFLSTRSRIQSERGHTVAQHGPYRFVRHPMYASRIVLIMGAALGAGVVDRASTSRLDRTPARPTDLVGRSHAEGRTARLSDIRGARSRAPRTRPVVTRADYCAGVAASAFKAATANTRPEFQ